MNRHSLLTSALLTTLLAGSASAGGFEGGTVRLGFYDIDSGADSVTDLAGSAVFGLNGKLSVQGDLNFWSDYSGGDVSDFGIHLIYTVAPRTVVGAFYNYEEWDGFGYDQIGIEGKTQIASGARPITLEAFLSTEDSLDIPATYNYAGIGISAAISGNLDAFGSVASVSDASDVSALSAGVRYHVPSGLYGEASLTSVSSGGSDITTLGFVAGYNFGNGATFGQRNWVSYFNGFN